MIDTDAAPAAVRAARRLKEHTVSAGRPFLPPVIATEHAGRLAWLAIAPEADIEAALVAAEIAWTSGTWDALSFAMDTCFVLGAIGESPEAIRRRYPPGAIQDAWERGGPAAREVGHALIVHHQARAGARHIALLPYRPGTPGRAFAWLDEGAIAARLGRGVRRPEAGGPILDRLRRVVRRPPEMEAEDVRAVCREQGIGPRLARAIARDVADQVLRGYGYAVLGERVLRAWLDGEHLTEREVQEVLGL
jgi:hypothetical protein